LTLRDKVNEKVRQRVLYLLRSLTGFNRPWKKNCGGGCKDLKVVKQIASGLLTSCVAPLMHALAFQAAEEAFHARIVVAVFGVDPIVWTA